jgi:hypothetical protein
MAKDGSIVLRTDKAEYRIYPERQEIKVYPLTVEMGEVVPRRTPSRAIRRSEFDKYPQAWATIIEWMNLWG